jgi:hypothetical protein
MKRILLGLLLISAITGFPIGESLWNHAEAQDRVTTPSLGIAKYQGICLLSMGVDANHRCQTTAQDKRSQQGH